MAPGCEVSPGPKARTQSGQKSRDQIPLSQRLGQRLSSKYVARRLGRADPSPALKLHNCLFWNPLQHGKKLGGKASHDMGTRQQFDGASAKAAVADGLRVGFGWASDTFR